MYSEHFPVTNAIFFCSHNLLLFESYHVLYFLLSSIWINLDFFAIISNAPLNILDHKFVSVETPLALAGVPFSTGSQCRCCVRLGGMGPSILLYVDPSLASNPKAE